MMLVSLAWADGVTLRRGNTSEPGTVDPQKVFTTYEMEILRDLYCGLLQMDAMGKAIPGVAERWDVSADGLTLTFHLRADAKWSDGAPVVAADFVLGMRRAFDPKVAAPYANLAYVIRNAKEVVLGHQPPEALGVKAADAATLEITLERPSQTIIWLLGAYPMLFPLPSHVYRPDSSDWLAPAKMVSNGPFTLTEWVPNDHMTMKKNPAFFDASSVAIDEVIYYPTDDDAAAVKRFRNGELDLNTRFPPSLYQMLKHDLPNETRVTPASWIGYIVMNQTDPRFADKRVRRALSLAIDRDMLVNRVLNNGELPAWSLVPPGTENFTPSGAADYSAMSMAERIAEARRLLAEAGYSEANPLTFTFNHRIGEANKRSAVSIQDMWKAIGVNVTLQSSEVAGHYDLLRQGKFEVADGGWSAPRDAEYFFYLARSDSEDMNYGKWSNAEFDRLSDMGNREQDLTKRGEYYREAERILGEEQGVIAVYIPVERSIVHTWVKGFEPNGINYHPTRWMHIEGRP
jgi:oligopeptide transport system substrate-binding protein